MTLLINLEKYNISFNIIILEKNDCILSKLNKNTQLFYILNGFMQKLQIFTNNEAICLQLLENKDIIIDKKKDLLYYKKINYYYKVIALKRTIILTINRKEFIKKLEGNQDLLKIIKAPQLNKHNIMLSIMAHKNTKKRLIQLLLILIKNFGIFTKSQLIIPMKLSHYDIATIIGCQRVTINKIMSQLKKNRLFSTMIRKFSS